jgi:uncharacterized protein YyaL (SSP411 family)
MADRLVDAHSAYLHSARDQPVDWYPWGPDAFARAQDEDKPILLDIGAVWCHWCHVMDHESYEDPAIAELLNEEWVCIKVDRDERPDVDARYQRAVQALTGQGGWPLTAFLTPDGDVFYAGTYFPPDGRMGRPGFRTVLISLARAYREQRHHLQDQAAEITKHLSQASPEAAPGDPSADLLAAAIDGISRVFDPRHGGFGDQPKFPHPGVCELLLARWFDTGDAACLEMVERTLAGMARGGMYDQVGGGFHRYSVDARWIVPHFEKMLYDNAELLKAYASAAASSAWSGETHALFRRVVAGIAGWVMQAMADPDGGYFASQDADVEPGDDGNYFTWTIDEARAALDDDEFEVASRHYDIGARGEMHHDPNRNVLWVSHSIADIASALARDPADIASVLERARAQLLAVRANRPTPFVDPTLYAAWNGMMASAMLRAGAVLEQPALETHALATLERFFEHAGNAKDELHIPHAIGSAVTGILDDQVQLASAALDAFETTGERRWLERTVAIMNTVWHHYRADSGGLRDVHGDRSGEGFLSQELVPVQDTPTPSPNGTAAIVLARLAELLPDSPWPGRRSELLFQLAGTASDLSIHGAALLRAIDWAVSPVTQVVIVGTDEDVTRRLVRTARAAYRPRLIVRLLAPTADTDGLPPALAAMLDGTSPRAYVCAGMQCAPPVGTPEDLAEVLRSFGR